MKILIKRNFYKKQQNLLVDSSGSKMLAPFHIRLKRQSICGSP